MFEPIKALSECQIEQFRNATEELLEDVGFHVTNADLLRRARTAGAKVDDASHRVRLPAPLLRELLAQIPRSYRVTGLDGIEYVVGEDARASSPSLPTRGLSTTARKSRGGRASMTSVSTRVSPR